jgi:hypothetical protein
MRSPSAVSTSNGLSGSLGAGTPGGAIGSPSSCTVALGAGRQGACKNDRDCQSDDGLSLQWKRHVIARAVIN